MILNPGFNLTLRPMQYPVYFEMFKTAIKNTWTVEEVDFSTDVTDLRARMTPAEQHLIKRLVAFFATGDSIVGNNLARHLLRQGWRVSGLARRPPDDIEGLRPVAADQAYSLLPRAPGRNTTGSPTHSAPSPGRGSVASVK